MLLLLATASAQHLCTDTLHFGFFFFKSSTFILWMCFMASMELAVTLSIRLSRGTSLIDPVELCISANLRMIPSNSAVIQKSVEFPSGIIKRVYGSQTASTSV